MRRITKQKSGPKSRFSEELSVRICELTRRGLTLGRVSKVMGIPYNTLINWTKIFPEFLWSLNEAKNFSDEFVEKNLFTRASGYTYDTEKIFVTKAGRVIRVKCKKHHPPDVTAQIFWLKNRKPKEWKNDFGWSKAAATGDICAKDGEKKCYSEFCAAAGYPQPYVKQIEMKEFVIDDESNLPRLLLGSRGYGKTDYCVILGIAYKLYEDAFETQQKPKWTCLLVTKSDQRNAAIVAEVAKALLANGVELEKENASELRVAGLHGKDHSLSAVTIGTSSLRGRHPKQVTMEDVVTEDDVSQATRKKVQRVYNEVNKLTQNVVVIGQPVHVHDLYQTLRPLQGVKKMEVPHGAIPELDHDLEAQRLAGVSEESIQASYFLKVFSESEFPFEDVKYIDVFPKGDSVAFLDPSFKGGDLTALSVFKAHFDGMAVQGHVWKRAWNHCLDEVVARLLDLGVKRFCFETNSLGDQPVIMLREALDGSGIGVIGRNSVTNKHSRILNAASYAHLIHLSKKSDAKYIEHVVKYEYGYEPDDPADSLATGLEWLGLIRGKAPGAGK